MCRTSILNAVALSSGLLAWPAPSYGQTGSTSKACQLLPAAELEAHFGAKASPVRGSDTSSVSTCAVDIPDRQHGADLILRPAAAPLTVEQRLAGLGPHLERQGSQIKTFGNVGCFTDKLDLGPTKLSVATCFLDNGGYLSLSLRSEDPKQATLEAAKELLEKAAAKRK
jgi:hypothetical protein